MGREGFNAEQNQDRAYELLLLSRDALHIHVGLGIYVLAMLIFRRGPASPVPWLVVVAFELMNEALDAVHGQHFDLDITGATRDLGNTMLWPTVALLMARWLAWKRQPKLAERANVIP